MTSMFALWASALLTFGGAVTEVTITPMQSETSVLITVDGDVEFRDFTMEGPYRLVVDLMDAQHALPSGRVRRGESRRHPLGAVEPVLRRRRAHRLRARAAPRLHGHDGSPRSPHRHGEPDR